MSFLSLLLAVARARDQPILDISDQEKTLTAFAENLRRLAEERRRTSLR